MSGKIRFSSLILKPKSIFFAYIADFCYFLICTHRTEPRLTWLAQAKLNEPRHEVLSSAQLSWWPGLGV